jgi:hypothetical protein
VGQLEIKARVPTRMITLLRIGFALNWKSAVPSLSSILNSTNVRTASLVNLAETERREAEGEKKEHAQDGKGEEEEHPRQHPPRTQIYRQTDVHTLEHTR